MIFNNETELYNTFIHIITILYLFIWSNRISPFWNRLLACYVDSIGLGLMNLSPPRYQLIASFSVAIRSTYIILFVNFLSKYIFSNSNKTHKNWPCITINLIEHTPQLSILWSEFEQNCNYFQIKHFKKMFA